MKSSVTVIGGANLDIGGFSHKPLAVGDSNPGTVTISPGGVGRNIAHNIRLLGMDTRFVAAFGSDANGEMLLRHCEQIGLDMSLSAVIPGRRTSTYLFIADDTHDMQLAISDMDIVEEITPDFLAPRMDAINGGSVLVLDANLSEDTIAFIAEHATVPIIVDPVSGIKCVRLRSILDKITVLKPNALEAGVLTGEDTSSREGISRASTALVAQGVKRVLVSMGADGVCYADSTGYAFMPAVPAEVQNTTGAGDAFTAGICAAVLQGASLHETALMAQAAASIACESVQTVNPSMSFEHLKEKMKSEQE